MPGRRWRGVGPRDRASLGFLWRCGLALRIASANHRRPPQAIPSARNELPADRLLATGDHTVLPASQQPQFARWLSGLNFALGGSSRLASGFWFLVGELVPGGVESVNLVEWQGGGAVLRPPGSWPRALCTSWGGLGWFALAARRASPALRRNPEARPVPGGRGTAPPAHFDPRWSRDIPTSLTLVPGGRGTVPTAELRSQTVAE